MDNKRLRELSGVDKLTESFDYMNVDEKTKSKLIRYTKDLVSISKKLEKAKNEKEMKDAMELLKATTNSLNTILLL